MKFLSKNRLIVLLIGLLPGSAIGLSTDREQPILIKAEQVEIDRTRGFSRYQGHVRFQQGSLVIHGGMVLLYHKDGVIEKAIIHGNPASFQQTPDKGEASIVSRANKMEYIAQSSRLFLFESAKVSQGNNSFSGEKIEYDIVKGTVVANKGVTGNNRIHAVIEQEKD